MQPFRLFLSSPGDCGEERQAVHDIAGRLNADPLVSHFTRIEVVAWDQGKGIPLELLTSPQASVDRHLPAPEACDVFIGIFKCRLGTPLPVEDFRKFDGNPFLSGSEYEFHRAWEQRRRGASVPEMLVYRQETPACDDQEQLKRLENFFGRLPFKEGGAWVGSVTSYQSALEFADKLEADLRQLLRQRQPGASQPLNDWLRHQADHIKHNAGPRYTASAHVESEIGQVFDWLLARQTAIAELDERLSEVWQYLGRDEEFSGLRDEVGVIARAFRDDPHWHGTPDFAFIRNVQERIREQAWTQHRLHEQNKPETAESNDDWRHREYQLRQCAYKSSEVIHLLDKHSGLTRQRVMLLTGPAGQGKTHTLVHEILQTVASGGIGVGVLGQTLSVTGGLWEAICKRLAWTGSHEQLLDKLESEAALRHQRGLLVIDALNETPDRKRWRNELTGMIQEVLRRPHLALVLSVRDDYLEVTLPVLPEGDEQPWVERDHPGFSGIEPDALLRYFEHYTVKAPVAPPLGEFSNPLYVQLLAKSMQGRPLRHWLPSWLEVWQAWMDRLEEEARDKLGLDDASRRQSMRRTMYKLAAAMLEGDSFSLPRSQADAIANAATCTERVIDFLCSAGALIDRMEEEDDIIEFGFERLSDTFLADRLLKQLWENLDSREARREALQAALAPGGVLHPLATERSMDHPLHFRRAGLLEALCLATPPKTGVELPGLMPRRDAESWDRTLDNAFSDSLRWRANPEDFGADRTELVELWRDSQHHAGLDGELDELIRFAMIPGHPFAMESLIHPRLLAQDSPGTRDALWSIHLVPLWFSEHTNLRQLVTWARDANLHGVQADVALPAARLLAWVTATSQNELRQAAMKGLTRILVACPRVLEAFLPDFLEVNDPYILEGVLVAVWGVTLDGADQEMAAQAAKRVYESQFPEGQARWPHLTLRHYARLVVETAHERGWLSGLDLTVVRPPYRSTLPLIDVPDITQLKALDDSSGFLSLYYSATSGDFHLYVMGGNSPSLPFSSKPLADSSEPERPYLKAQGLTTWHSNPEMFDLALASRYVAWNCLRLGWTGERFEAFDTGHYASQHSRMPEEGHTERIGKKYQWIGWYTLLGFLSDNYPMRSRWRGDESLQYDQPAQVDVHLHDPSRWLQDVTPLAQTKDDSFWAIPSLPSWPQPDLRAMCEWVASCRHDLPPADVIAHIPDLPQAWGGGPWLRVAAEHIWSSHFAPGQWAVRNKYLADLGWQSWPLLIRKDDLPKLLLATQERRGWEELADTGRLDPDEEWNVSLSAWPTHAAEWDEGFVTGRGHHFSPALPTPWRPLIGSCGHPDRRDEHRPVLLPTPSLFREWKLELDLRRGMVLHEGEPLFGLAGWVHGEDALFVRLEPLQVLLENFGYALIWTWRGERRGFMDLGMQRREDTELAWANYHGIGFLAADGRIHTMRSEKELLKRQ